MVVNAFTEFKPKLTAEQYARLSDTEREERLDAFVNYCFHALLDILRIYGNAGYSIGVNLQREVLPDIVLHELREKLAKDRLQIRLSTSMFEPAYNESGVHVFVPLHEIAYRFSQS